MEANELRIGNYLIDPRGVSKDIVERFKIREDGIFKVKITDLCYASEYKGISLTPEMLEKCGFVKKRRYNANHYFKIILKTDFYLRASFIGGFYWGFDMDKNNMDCEFNDLTRLEYLHELQNLYFALTKTELEINL